MKKLFLFFVFLLLISCDGSREENLIQTFLVASERRSCDGYVQNQQCLLIKLHESETSWSFFYEPIIGFDYETGFEYEIRVNREYIEENEGLADRSVYKYTLLEILSKQEKISEGLD